MIPSRELDSIFKSIGDIAPSCVTSIKSWIDCGGYVVSLQQGIACRITWQESQITLITVNKVNASNNYLTIGVPLRILESSKIPEDSILKWRDDLSTLKYMTFDSGDNGGTMLISSRTPAKNITMVFDSARAMIDRL